MADIKTEQKPAQVPTLTVDDVVNKIIPALAASLKGNQPAAVPMRAQNAPLEKCPECGQAKIGCKGLHLEMVVYPTKYPQHADYFPGVKINGVTYLSNDESHKVLVPAEAEATILGIVAGFEQNEQDMAVGRKAVRHSGTVSPGGSRVTPANQAWR